MRSTLHRLAGSLASLGILATPLVLTGERAGAQQPAPPDYGAVSVNLEDVPYPYPVSFLPLTVHGQAVRMAYMDVKPSGAPNGRTVVLHPMDRTDR